jgi:putative FmdB family regulatory protein
MPTYDYQCANCGPFRDSYPMSAFADPQPCPVCDALAPRALTVPALSGGAQEAPSASSAASWNSHGGGCACCAAPRRPLTAEAV